MAVVAPRPKHHEFTATRRTALLEVFARAERRGEIIATVDADLLVHQAFGVLWYHMLTGHGALDDAAAELAACLG